MCAPLVGARIIVTGGMETPDPLDSFHEALERRHLAELSFPEVRRALQALSSLYVERRERMAGGAALDGAGKRAAFALYYGPMHFLLVREIVRALAPSAGPGASSISAAAPGPRARRGRSRASRRARVEGVDRNGWAVTEARWTYARLGLDGRATRADATTAPLPKAPAGILAAFTVNELADAARRRAARAARRGREGGIDRSRGRAHLPPRHPVVAGVGRGRPCRRRTRGRVALSPADARPARAPRQGRRPRHPRADRPVACPAWIGL